MAEICLTYLNSQHIKALSADSFDDLPTLTHENPFLEYCSLYWGAHARKELSNFARSLALQLFKEYDGHISLAVFADKTWDTRSVDIKDSLWSGLHYASFFGIVEVVAASIEMRCYDLNERHFRGSTPLSCAAKNGHEEVVKILLGWEEVNLNKADNFDDTPISDAAQGRHEGVVKILLRRDEVDPEKPNIFHTTPLVIAALGGHEE